MDDKTMNIATTGGGECMPVGGDSDGHLGAPAGFVLRGAWLANSGSDWGAFIGFDKSGLPTSSDENDPTVSKLRLPVPPGGAVAVDLSGGVRFEAGFSYSSLGEVTGCIWYDRMV